MCIVQKKIMQAGHETTIAYSVIKYFFTKSGYSQTYQNYQQSWKKLDTFLGNKVFKNSKFSKINQK